MSAPVLALAALVVGVIAVARAARLVTSDTWPPMAAVRERWKVRTAPRVEDVATGEPIPLYDDDGKIAEGPWTPLLTCPFCFAPYAAAVSLTWAVLAGVPTVDPFADGWTAADGWWLVHIWAAVSYLAAMLVARDEPAPVIVDVDE